VIRDGLGRLISALEDVELVKVAVAVAPAPNRSEASLSERASEVLALLVEGLPNKLIVLCLRISEKTVKSHLTRTLRRGAKASGTRSRGRLLNGSWRSSAFKPARATRTAAPSPAGPQRMPGPAGTAATFTSSGG
jgi:DNA-binding CsgD family transcriptional regulator